MPLHYSFAYVPFKLRAGPRDVAAGGGGGGGGGGTESRSLEPSGESREGEYEMGDEHPLIGLPRKIFQNLYI